MFTSLYSKFIQETVCQISSESPEFCPRYYQKHFGLFFSVHTVYTTLIRGWSEIKWFYYNLVVKRGALCTLGDSAVSCVVNC